MSAIVSVAMALIRDTAKLDDELYERAHMMVLAEPDLDLGPFDDGATVGDLPEHDTIWDRVDAKYLELLAARDGQAAADAIRER